MRQYSPFFQTLHDDTGPVGHLGRGTHYSVLRCVVWHNSLLESLSRAEFHDFAIIWDEDHDVRVIPVIEQLYFSGLLSAALFIGERKGSFSVVTEEPFAESVGSSKFEEFVMAVKEFSEGQEDSWPTYVGGFPEHDYIINDSKDRVGLYLRNIHGLWSLGNRRI